MACWHTKEVQKRRCHASEYFPEMARIQNSQQISSRILAGNAFENNCLGTPQRKASSMGNSQVRIYLYHLGSLKVFQSRPESSRVVQSRPESSRVVVQSHPKSSIYPDCLLNAVQTRNLCCLTDNWFVDFRRWKGDYLNDTSENNMFQKYRECLRSSGVDQKAVIFSAPVRKFNRHGKVR